MRKLCWNMLKMSQNGKQAAKVTNSHASWARASMHSSPTM